jgi:hypothetical protein
MQFKVLETPKSAGSLLSYATVRDRSIASRAFLRRYPGSLPNSNAGTDELFCAEKELLHNRC